MTDANRVTPAAADPAPLGFAAFAVTAFVLSAHNAGWAPNLVWVGLALFYGGVAQFVAGTWAFRNRDTFLATAFVSYGAFWLSLASLAVLDLQGQLSPTDVSQTLAWFVLGFLVFNTYMLLWSRRAGMAVLAFFLTLEVTEAILSAGYFRESLSVVRVGGFAGIATAAVAFYASAARLATSMSRRQPVPDGEPQRGATAAAPSGPPTPTVADLAPAPAPGFPSATPSAPETKATPRRRAPRRPTKE